MRATIKTMERLRFTAALFVAQTISLLIKIFTKGGGTAAPGLYALKIDPNLIPKLSKQIGQGTIIVAGTNGKTTTARMIAKMLEASRYSYVHNKEGSNLMRGIASALANKSNVKDKSDRTHIADYALWELDEATLPQFLSQVTPKIIVLTNLFRDQLDRYGEVAKIRKDWQKALATLPSNTTIILNADDPAIAYLGMQTPAQVLYFGVESNSRTNKVETTADANFCPICNKPLVYDAIYYSHIGKYHCKEGHFARPMPTITAKDLQLDEKGSTFRIEKKQQLMLGVPGIYNIYNALAAIVTAQHLGISMDQILQSLAQFQSVFGRAEEVKIDNKLLRLFLVKNPTGFNEVLTVTLVQEQKLPLLIIGINDNFADGRDVSWLWDVDFEKLKGHATKVVCTGIRAYDMANRLKYAEFDGKVVVEQDMAKLMSELIKYDNTKSMPLLLTYTAMLDFRQYLAKKGYIKHYLQES